MQFKSVLIEGVFNVGGRAFDIFN